jgi:nitroreductase/NAD-dependent dihydropyrimidine dehydrogenase PreA subunit
MGLLNIDVEKCNRDGFCAKECPSAIIRLEKEGDYPEVASADERACLICGHCVAVCPSGALSHARIPIETCPPIKRKSLIDEEEAIQFLRSRRSIRRFRDRAVEREKIQRVIEIARYAPTAGNTQLVEWSVFTDRDKIKDIARQTVDWMRQALKDDPQSVKAPYIPRVVAAWDAGHDEILRNAPVLIVASAPKQDLNGMVNLTLSLSYLDLIAPTLGLGTCWAGLIRRALLFCQEVKEAIGLPEGHDHAYLMMLGYPQLKYYRLPERKQPKIHWR